MGVGLLGSSSRKGRWCARGLSARQSFLKVVPDHRLAPALQEAAALRLINQGFKILASGENRGRDAQIIGAVLIFLAQFLDQVFSIGVRFAFGGLAELMRELDGEVAAQATLKVFCPFLLSVARGIPYPEGLSGYFTPF